MSQIQLKSAFITLWRWVLSLCRKIENKEFSETPRKVRGFIGQIFRFSIASGWWENDPTTHVYILEWIPKYIYYIS